MKRREKGPSSKISLLINIEIIHLHKTKNKFCSPKPTMNKTHELIIHKRLKAINTTHIYQMK
jgi:hypothetical protein